MRRPTAIGALFFLIAVIALFPSVVHITPATRGKADSCGERTAPAPRGAGAGEGRQVLHLRGREVVQSFEDGSLRAAQNVTLTRFSDDAFTMYVGASASVSGGYVLDIEPSFYDSFQKSRVWFLSLAEGAPIYRAEFRSLRVAGYVHYTKDGFFKGFLRLEGKASQTTPPS